MNLFLKLTYLRCIITAKTISIFAFVVESQPTAELGETELQKNFKLLSDSEEKLKPRALFTSHAVSGFWLAQREACGPTIRLDSVHQL